MAEPAPRLPQAASKSASGSLFNTREELDSTRTTELVLALCGPIGSDIHKVGEKLQELLKRDFGYPYCEIIRLSEIIREQSKGAQIPTDEYEKLKRLIELGDELRQKHGNGVLAEIAVGKIAYARRQAERSTSQTTHQARRVCHIIDSIKNQEELDILRAVYGDMVYFVGVFSSVEVRVKNLEKRPMTPDKIWELIDKDSGEEFSYGQTVRNTFPQADFFLRTEFNNDAEIESKVERFLHLILNSRVLTPSFAEQAMYAAASAAGNSACLSRQVGAALTDAAGEIISIGWNDVPKFGGGLYGADPADDPTGKNDQRCWNREGGLCYNDQYKRLTAESLVAKLVKEKFIDVTKSEDAIKCILEDSQLKDLIEFSRSIHAEMHAIIVGCKLGGDRVRGGKLFTTTYPCHSCARHIVDAGISEVYYIEPYRKSLATKLHDDSITENEKDTSRVVLLPYNGVAPSKYLKLFRMTPDSRKKNGKMIKIDFREASPRFEKRLEAFPKLEAMIVEGLVRKKLIPETNEQQKQEAPKAKETNVVNIAETQL
jgi:deoxycytidylate deaminase